MVFSKVLLRLCLFVPTLVGAVSLFDISIANAIESPNVNIKRQTGINHLEPNLLEDLENSIAIATDTTTNTADTPVLKPAIKPANIQADNIEHQSSNPSEALAQSVTEAAPQDSTIHLDELSQVIPVSQSAGEQPASLDEGVPDANDIDSIEPLDSSALDQLTSVTQLSDVQPTD